MHVFHARGFRRFLIGDTRQLVFCANETDHLFDQLPRHAARTQNCGRMNRHVENGRFDADPCLATVDDERNPPFQIRQHMGSFRRARLAAAIRARCSERSVQCSQKLERYRMIRHPDADCVEARCDIFRNDTGPLMEDECQRTWPKCLHQLLRVFRHVYRIVIHIFFIANMYDERVIGRAPLRFEDPLNGARFRRKCSKAVHRLGRKRDNASIF